jgi:transcriptional regulator with XRE-family HTH domain
MPTRSSVEASRRAESIARALAEEIRRLREDCGMSQRALARAAGVPQSMISRIEGGGQVPSVETCSRLATGLGADLSIRLYPNTGPQIRDRHQARIAEALVRSLPQRWKAFLEVGVRQPVRGWIDLVLVDRPGATVIAAEIETSPQRFEQMLRWAGSKAEAIGSAAAYPFGIEGVPAVHRLLILRDTEANRALVTAFGAQLRAAYPADPWQARAAITGESAWPGAALLWARSRPGGEIEILATPRVPRTLATR